jgi:hypothetical protein
VKQPVTNQVLDMKLLTQTAAPAVWAGQGPWPDCALRLVLNDAVEAWGHYFLAVTLTVLMVTQPKRDASRQNVGII